MIAGDMRLSTISTNVSVWSIDPEGDPLRLFLESIARYRMFFAMGEAIAHLHRLYYAGSARRTLGADGVMRYARA